MRYVSNHVDRKDLTKHYHLNFTFHKITIAQILTTLCRRRHISRGMLKLVQTSLVSIFIHISRLQKFCKFLEFSFIWVSLAPWKHIRSSNTLLWALEMLNNYLTTVLSIYLTYIDNNAISLFVGILVDFDKYCIRIWDEQSCLDI